MLVRTKRQVQKSFRIDEDVERDLGVLAKITERSQNELANVALEELLQDNKVYFVKSAVFEHFSYELESGEDPKPFEMGGLKVEMKYLDNGGVEIRSIVGEEVFIKEFNDSVCDELEEYLLWISLYIDPHAKDTEEYLNDRTDYRDYVKIRKV